MNGESQRYKEKIREAQIDRQIQKTKSERGRYRKREREGERERDRERGMELEKSTRGNCHATEK